MTTATMTTLNLLAQKGIFPARTDDRSIKNKFLYLCPLPSHSDNNPSFSIHSDEIQWNCFPCGQGGGPRKLLELLDGPAVYSPPKAPKAPKPAKLERLQGCTLAQLAESKNLPIEALKAAGWTDSRNAGVSAISIPYETGTRYRVGLDTGDRFRWAKGGKPWLYGDIAAAQAAGWVLLCEGETDTISGQLMGLPVLGVPGASTWRPEWALTLSSLDIYVWKEPDHGGETFIRKIAASFDAVLVTEPPQGIKDINDLLSQCGSPEAAREYLNELLDDEAYYWAPEDGPADKKLNTKTENVPIRDRFRTKGDLPLGVLSLIGTFGQPQPLRNNIYAETAANSWPDPLDCKPTLVGYLTLSNGIAKARNLIGHTWSNPFNAQRHRRARYEAIMPRLDDGSRYYSREFAVEDVTDAQHEAISKQIERAGGKYLRFDHSISAHSYTYLSDIALDGWQPVADLSPWLIEVLTRCQGPEYIPGQKRPGRYRPVIGSRSWTQKPPADSSDSAPTVTVAIAPKGIDFKLFRAVLSVQFGIDYKSERSNNPLQVGPTLSFPCRDLREAEQIALAAGMILKPVGKRQPNTRDLVAA